MKKGTKHSEESKKKISKSMKGTKKSEETRRKMSKAKKKWATSKVTCPYCGAEGAPRIMNRWHFERCKMNPKNLPHSDISKREE